VEDALTSSPLSSARVIRSPQNQVRIGSKSLGDELSNVMMMTMEKLMGEEAYKTAARTDHLLEILYFY
jgi:hypothetical protein